MKVKSFLIGVLLPFLSSASFAIGDSAGCGRNKQATEVASFGNPAQMEVLIDGRIDQEWGALPTEVRKILRAKSETLIEWQRAIRRELLSNSYDRCGTGWLLDYAVGNGNLEVVHWLLDQGADPSGAAWSNNADTIFIRCPTASSDPRPDEVTPDQVAKRMQEAYRLLIARGGDHNRVSMYASAPGQNALVRCGNIDMLKVLLDLGVERSPQRRQQVPHLLPGGSRILLDSGNHNSFAPLQIAVGSAFSSDMNHAALDRVRLLAESGYNDLRGTRIENTIYSQCLTGKFPNTCEALSSIVKLSPGVIPGRTDYNPKPGELVRTEFAPQRESCAFPEIFFAPDYDIVMVAAPQSLDNSGKPKASRISVTVNHPGKPIFLSLESNLPAIWSIQKTPGTDILGVIASSWNHTDIEDLIWGLDPSIPRSVGYGCRAHFAFLNSANGIRPQLLSISAEEIKGYGTGVQSLDPTQRAEAPLTAIVQGDRVHIGNPLTENATLIPKVLPEQEITSRLCKTAAIDMRSLMANRLASQILAPPLIVDATSVSKACLPPPADSELSGKAKLDQLVKDNSLRRANITMYAIWLKEAFARMSLFRRIPKVVPSFENAYLASDEGIIPADLHGADAAIFFLPAKSGLRRDLGDSTVFLYGQSEDPARLAGTCKGPMCQ